MVAVTLPPWPSGFVHPIRSDPQGWCPFLQRGGCPLQCRSPRVPSCALVVASTGRAAWRAVRGFSACPGTSQGGWDPWAAVSHWITGFEPQGHARGGAPDGGLRAGTRGGRGQGWHPSVPTAAMAEAAPLRAVRGSCQACVHHPHSAVSQEVSVSGDAQERLVLPGPIPDGHDSDGDAFWQPGMMPLCCQESGTSLHRDPGEQPRPLAGWHVSPPPPLGTSSPHPVAAALCGAAMEGFLLPVSVHHRSFLQGTRGGPGVSASR